MAASQPAIPVPAAGLTWDDDALDTADDDPADDDPADDDTPDDDPADDAAGEGAGEAAGEAADEATAEDDDPPPAAGVAVLDDPHAANDNAVAVVNARTMDR